MSFQIKILIYFSLLLFISNWSYSQGDTTSFLALYKPHAKHNRVVFPVGYEYVFDIKGSKEQVVGVLEKAKDSLIYLSTDTVHIRQIKKIHTPIYRNGVYFFRQLFAKGGLGLMIIGPFNNLINKEKPIIGPLGYTGAGLVLTSRLLKFFELKVYRVNKGRTLRTVYFY